MNERLGRIVEDSASEVYIFSVESFKFVLVNRGGRENLGYSMDELRSLTPWDLKPIEEHKFREFVAPLLTGTIPRLDFFTQHKRKNGTLYDVYVRLQVMEFGPDKVFFAAIQDVSDRVSIERQLQDKTLRLNAILNNTKMAVFMMDARQHCVFMNEAAEKLTGYRFEETQGRPLHDVIHHTHPDGRPYPISECMIDRAFPQDNQVQGEDVFIHKDGSFYPVGFTASPIRGPDGIPIGTVIEVQNIQQEIERREAMTSFYQVLQSRIDAAIAEREQIEAQLRQSQKLEAIGKLTGGIAHDFNNLLQIIGGNLQLLVNDVDGNSRAAKRVQMALTGVSRGAKLASQLLAFGRRQPLAPKVVNLGRLVQGMDDLLRRALGEAIEIETVIAGGLWNTLVDPDQVENALLNLAINSRDAMEGRGKLTIECGNSFLDENYVQNQKDVRPGQYVVLAVTDTGCGIPKDIIDQVFEPFFSTKAEGQGSGLGLSMVYGLVKQSGGHIKIYSEPDQGTTVRLYFPRETAREETLPSQTVNSPSPRGTETILLVEDDEAVRTTAHDMLTDLGYRVLSARNADSAWAVIESGVAIDLLFTDVVMPGTLKSPELARKAQLHLPNLAVLFTSGYTQNAIVHGGRLDEGVELLSKPYTRDELSRKIRQILTKKQQQPLAEPTPPARGAEPSPHRSLRILLLEDEVLVRMTVADMLAELGHTLVEAGRITEARAALAEPFDVLIADLSLPDGSAIDFIREMVQCAPAMAIIVASGHDASVLGDLPVGFLPKPYDPVTLAQALASLALPVPT